MNDVFFDKVLLRTPFYSVDDYDLARLPLVAQQKDFQNALWLASPEFYELLQKKGFDRVSPGSREYFSLQKYYNRMSFRPVPFGSFAAFTFSPWSRERRLKLAKSGESILHLLPALTGFFEMSESSLHENVELRANPLLYRLGKEWRYMGAIMEAKGNLRFNIRAVDANNANDFLISECCRNAAGKSQLVERLAVYTGCTIPEAVDYIHFLIAEQVLLAKTAGLIEPDAKDEIDTYLANGCLSPRPQFCSHKLEHLSSLTTIGGGSGNGKTGQPWYAGLERTVFRGGMDESVQQSLKESVGVLQKITYQAPNRQLAAFVRDFNGKFESQRISLLKALDPDAGIGYAGLHQEETSLNGLRFPASETGADDITWTPVHRLFLKLGLGIGNRGDFSPIEIRPQDLDGLPDVKSDQQPPPGISILYSRTSDYLVLDAVGGASATALIGRFSVFSPQITALCREIAAAEEEANPGIVFAELHQLSHRHVDNINRRNRVYDHIIPLYACPDESIGTHILPEDLLLSVVNGQLVLESVSLGKRVIPRLPTAYNYRHTDLPVFRLLCDMQFQGLQTDLSFNLERLFPGLTFYPRVTFRNCILALARWYLSKDELHYLREGESPLGRLHIFRQQRGIPQWVSLGLSDQLLVFDLGNDREALFFLECLRNESRGMVREYLPPGDFVTADRKKFAAQTMAFLQRKSAVYSPVTSRTRIGDDNRTFVPGSEWLYIKIYCTPASANKVLELLVKPILNKFDANLRCWFFIRYQDPDHHLRVRFRSKDRDPTFILKELEQLLSTGQGEGLVRDYKNDTYYRELERYSAELIDQVEDFFRAGSEEVLRAIAEGNRKTDRIETDAVILVWQMCGIFLPGANDALPFLTAMQDRFMREFSADRQLRIDLDIRYREIGVPVRAALEDDQSGGYFDAALGAMLQPLTVLAKETVSWSPGKRNNFLADLIHMQLNRFFISRQREHETVVYYCCYKYAVSVAARFKNNA